jgi:hypothetical protein
MALPPLLHWFFGAGPVLFLVAIGIGVGFTLALAPQSHNIRLAHWSFGIAWFWGFGGVIEAFVELKLPSVISIPLVFVIAGIIGVLAFLSFRWVENNHQGTTATKPAPVAPKLSWATPTPVTSGTPLSDTQLNAVASEPGVLTYNPDVGAILPVGRHPLSVAFTPADAERFLLATANVFLVVEPAPPPKQGTQTSSEDKTASRHPLSKAEQAKFEKAAATQFPKGPIRISCPVADEPTCVYAAQFIDPLKRAGWVVDGGVVHRVTLNIATAGIMMTTYTPAAFDPAQNPDTGRVVQVPFSLMAVQEAFVGVGLGFITLGENDIPKDMINIYFGPEEPREKVKGTLRRSKDDVTKRRAYCCQHGGRCCEVR